MTDEIPTSEPTGDVDAHARMREPAEDAEASEDVEAHGGKFPAPAEDVEAHGGKFPAPAEDVEGHGRRSPGGSPAEDSGV